VDAGGAVALIAFIMVLTWIFNLANHADYNVMKSMWLVMSFAILTTISGLIYHGSLHLVKTFSTDPDDADVTILVVWILLMRVSVELVGIETRKKLAKPAQEMTGGLRVELDWRSWPVLTSYIAAFAMITAFTRLQLMIPIVCLRLVVAPLVWVGLKFIGAVIGFLWTQYMGKRKVDHHHKLTGFLIEKCSEEAEEDIISLSTSFLLVKVVLFLLDDDRMAEDGIKDGSMAFEPWNSLPQRGVREGVVLLLLAAFSFGFLKYAQGHPKDEQPDSKIMVEVKGVASMFTTWCLFFGTLWIVMGMNKGNDETRLSDSAQRALLLSIIALLAVFTVPRHADQDGPPTEKEVETRFNRAKALGAMIGLSWQTVLSVSMEGFVGPMKPARIGAALLLPALMIPAWRSNVLSRLVQLERQDNAVVAPVPEVAPGKGLNAPLLRTTSHISHDSHPSSHVHAHGHGHEHDRHEEPCPFTMLTLRKQLRRSFPQPQLQLQGEGGTTPQGPSPRASSEGVEVEQLRLRNYELERSLAKFKGELEDLMKMAEFAFTSP